LLVALALRQRLGRLHETAAAVGVFFEIHGSSPGLDRCLESAAGPSSLGGIV
jgi:hypothetical protein